MANRRQPQAPNALSCAIVTGK